MPIGSSSASEPVEVSFVLPCLNEAESLDTCIAAARGCIDRYELDAEVIVADNGSSDGSREIACRAGARVVHVPERGYGAALRGGFRAARGRYLIMGDADGSYDFGEAIHMIEALRSGADLVMGSRFRGGIEPGAMPWSHRWLGNPALSFVGRLFFHADISDFHCGLRGLSREAFDALDLRTTGMEFATEMVAKAAARGFRIEEVPITLYPDARSRPPHLRTWRDGWRHLRFILTLSPRQTLFVPGLLLMGFGLVVLTALAPGPLRMGPAVFDVHTMLVGSLSLIVGYQAVTTAVAARIFAIEEAIGPPAPWAQRAFRVFTLERGILAGLVLVLLGAGLIAVRAWSWAADGFPPLEPSVSMRPVLLGTTCAALGVQTVLMSFLYSMLGIKRRRSR